MKLNIKKSATKSSKSAKSAKKNSAPKSKLVVVKVPSNKTEAKAGLATTEKKVGFTRTQLVAMMFATGRNPMAWHDNKEIRDDLVRAIRDDKSNYSVVGGAHEYLAFKTVKGGDRIFKIERKGHMAKVHETLYLGNGVEKSTNAVTNLDLLAKSYGKSNIVWGSEKTIRSFIGNHAVSPKFTAGLKFE